MFIVSKILGSFFLPPGIILMLLASSFFLFSSQRKRAARVLLGVSILIFYILSIEPTSYALHKNLELAESIESPSAAAVPKADIIVVLGGGATPKRGYRPAAELSGSSWNRLWRAVELYKQLHGAVPLLYSGDSGALFDSGANEPLIAQNIANEMGVPTRDFLMDTQSRTTHESTLNVKRILDTSFQNRSSQRIYLVTSAQHMPRALEDMQRARMEAIPVPADFSGQGSLHVSLASFLPSADAFDSSVAALHEMVGRVAYRVFF